MAGAGDGGWEAKVRSEDLKRLPGVGLTRLDAFLSLKLGMSRRESKRLVEEGRVLVNGRRVRKPWFPLREGDEIEILGVSSVEC